jgi:copper(I)-binding protein
MIMKRQLHLIFTVLAFPLLLVGCTMPMSNAPHDEMAAGEMAHAMPMDESAMAEMPEMVDGELTVANVRANLALPSTTGSVWMVILNGTDTDDALIGAEIPGCGVIELHDMVMQGDVMVMQQVEGGQIPIPAGATVELKRGGLHVMCIDKAAPLDVGSNVDLVLHFANAGAISVTAPVVEPGEMSMDHGAIGDSGLMTDTMMTDTMMTDTMTSTMESK